MGESPAAIGAVSMAMDHRGICLRPALLAFFRANGMRLFDRGTETEDPVDYPFYAQRVAEDICCGISNFGVLVCGTGTGMAMAANRFRTIRAAVALSEEMAELSRRHGNANVLCLGSLWQSAEKIWPILHKFFFTAFEGGRHCRRLELMDKLGDVAMNWLERVDPEIFSLTALERKRQEDHIELIASENFASQAVIDATGSVLTNKYAEGYPGRRYYGGCEIVDKVERIARERALQLFGAEHVNVQPHSGSQANGAVYGAVLKPGDKILTMALGDGGHLTHGHPKNFSGALYSVYHYGTDSESRRIDYDGMEKIAARERPKLITVGASAYARAIDFERVAEIGHGNGALVLADMAHIAGLVAAGLHPSPIGCCDFVTSTTHKTLRGPRGGVIFCKKKFASAIDASVFPGQQGGPLMHIIAAKAVCFLEAIQPQFRSYQLQVLKNAKALAKSLADHGFHLVSGGTDNHLVLIDLRKNLPQMDGLTAQMLLDRANISLNRNVVPDETRSPFSGSGLRLGSPAVTTRSMGEREMEQIGQMIWEVLTAEEAADTMESVRGRVRDLCRRFPLPYANTP